MSFLALKDFTQNNGVTKKTQARSWDSGRAGHSGWPLRGHVLCIHHKQALRGSRAGGTPWPAFGASCPSSPFAHAPDPEPWDPSHLSLCFRHWMTADPYCSLHFGLSSCTSIHPHCYTYLTRSSRSVPESRVWDPRTTGPRQCIRCQIIQRVDVETLTPLATKAACHNHWPKPSTGL